MALSVTERKACVEMAGILYKFLPGSGSNQWAGHINFATVAERVGVGEFWETGSKTRAIRDLLERTLEMRRGLFQKLIMDVVSEGLLYTAGSADPISRDDIDKLNAALRSVHFQFPELIDSTFLSQLPSTSSKPNEVDLSSGNIEAYSPTAAKSHEKLETIRSRFYELASSVGRQHAGIELQSLLYDLLELHGMQPKSAYRVPGEEIDGSFVLDNEVYLLESKWEKDPVGQSDLLSFQGKIDGKWGFTRGLFLSISGVSTQALEAIRIGKQTSFVIADVSDLIAVLEARIRMDDLIRMKALAYGQRGKIFVRYSERASR